MGVRMVDDPGALTPETAEGAASTSVHTPSSLMAALEASLRTSRYTTPVLVRGVFRAGTGREYGGYFYDGLQDERVPTRRLRIKVPATVRAALPDGHVATLKGILTVRAQDTRDGLDVVFHVADAVGVERPAAGDADSARVEVVRAKAASGRKDLDGLLASAFYRGETPEIVAVTGLESIVDRDVLAALGPAVDAYRLRWRRVNLSSAPDLADALSSLAEEGPSIVALVRGGGSGLSIFDDPQVAKAAVRLPGAFVTALGHAADTTLLDMVADRTFETPSRFGQHLRDLWERVCAEKDHSLAALRSELEKTRERLDRARDELDRVRSRLWAQLALAAAAGALLALLLSSALHGLPSRLP